METVRAFIALELAPKVTLALTNVQDKLKSSNADVKWVNPRSVHLTLNFLGHINLEMVDKIKKILDQASKRHQNFELEIKALGAFPDIEHPRIIWVGIDKGSAICKSLMEDLEKSLINLGFLPQKRAHKAHLTLGRVRSARKRNELTKLLQTVEFKSCSMQAKTLTLFQSALTPTGAIYHPMHSISLS